ncbi:MAG: hypothetical protein RR555_09460 [Bacteroidales bacterium]
MRYFRNRKSYCKMFILLLLICGISSGINAQTSVQNPFQNLAQSPAQNPAYFKVESSKLSKDSILVGDHLLWSAVFKVPSDKRIAVAPYGEILKQDSVKLEVLKEIQLDTISIQSGISQLEAKLLLTSFDSGYYKLPQPLMIINGDTVYFDMPSVAVNPVQMDTATFKMYDIKGQINYPVTFKEVLPWILLGLLVIVIIYIVYRYIKYRREHKNFFGKPIVKDPPHIIALRELDKLRTQKLWQAGKEKQYYTGITDTLREYIEQRYDVSAMEKTSMEIMGSLTDKKMEAKPYNELNELFKLADLVKFAKYTPLEAENEDAIPIAVRFVNSTFMQELEQEVQQKQTKYGRPQRYDKPGQQEKQETTETQTKKKEEGK